MPTEVRMPELAPDMTEADLVSWLVKPGDRIEAGELLAEIETDKSTVEFESPVSGVLREIRVPEGTNGVTVGTVLALIDEDTGDTDPRPAASPAREPSPAPSAEPAEAAPPETAPAPRPQAVESPPEQAETPPASGGLASATALAKRLARQEGVDLERVAGTGAHGRITKADVQAAARSGAPASEAAPAPDRPAPASAEPFRSDTPFRVEPLSRMRRTIATRLQASKQTIPHFYLHVDCEIDRLLELRARLNAEGRRISVNDFVVRASALSLIEVPDANVSYGEEGLIRYERADVAVAVATEGGLVTPLVREADRKELEELSDELRNLATRAREGKLTPKEYQGGSFTVSNLGMFGVDSVYPIVNPPQSCILGVGQARARPVVRDGVLAVGQLMTITLSADHRAVDGAVGARLLAAVRRRLEDPLEMLL